MLEETAEVSCPYCRETITIVLDLSGHPEWAETAAKVMAPARTRVRRDSSRYLDVTVLIGRTWRPPAEPLYP